MQLKAAKYVLSNILQHHAKATAATAAATFVFVLNQKFFVAIKCFCCAFVAVIIVVINVAVAAAVDWVIILYFIVSLCGISNSIKSCLIFSVLFLCFSPLLLFFVSFSFFCSNLLMQPPLCCIGCFVLALGAKIVFDTVIFMLPLKSKKRILNLR